MAPKQSNNKCIGTCSECRFIGKKRVLVETDNLKMFPCNHETKIDYFVMDTKNYGCWQWEVKK